MDETSFFVTGPGETDGMLIAVAVLLFLIILGFGALYFTIQAWPDRLAKGAGKVQLQFVGLLGLISLLTLNNAFWIAALLVAAIRIPDFLTPIREIASSLKKQSGDGALTVPLRETAPPQRQQTGDRELPDD